MNSRESGGREGEGSETSLRGSPVREREKQGGRGANILGDSSARED